jgi:hypothetical protein
MVDRKANILADPISNIVRFPVMAFVIPSSHKTLYEDILYYSFFSLIYSLFHSFICTLFAMGHQIGIKEKLFCITSELPFSNEDGGKEKYKMNVNNATMERVIIQ